MPETQLQHMPLGNIHWPENERKQFDPKSLATLAESIRVHGVKQPIGVVAETDSRYRGLWGQRRLKAAVMAGLSTIPAIIHAAPKNELEAAEIRLMENVAREALSSMDLAEGLARLLAGGGTASQIASRVGMAGPAVSRSIALLKLSPAIQQQIRDGKISAAAGYELAQVDDLSARDELAQQAADGKLTRDDLIARRRKPVTPKPTAEGGASRATAKLPDGRSVTVCTPNIILETFINVLEQVLARAKQAHKKRLQLPTFLRVLRDTSRS